MAERFQVERDPQSDLMAESPAQAPFLTPALEPEAGEPTEAAPTPSAPVAPAPAEPLEDDLMQDILKSRQMANPHVNLAHQMLKSAGYDPSGRPLAGPRPTQPEAAAFIGAGVPAPEAPTGPTPLEDEEAQAQNLDETLWQQAGRYGVQALRVSGGLAQAAARGVPDALSNVLEQVGRVSKLTDWLVDMAFDPIDTAIEFYTGREDNRAYRQSRRQQMLAQAGPGGLPLPAPEDVAAKIDRVTNYLFDQPQTTAEKVVRDVVSFIATMGTLTKGMKVAGTSAARYGIAGGAVTDFFSIDPDTPSLLELVASWDPDLQATFKRYVRNPANSDAAEDQFLNELVSSGVRAAFDGIVYGAVFEGFLALARQVRIGHWTKQFAAGAKETSRRAGAWWSRTNQRLDDLLVGERDGGVLALPPGPEPRGRLQAPPPGSGGPLPPGRQLRPPATPLGPAGRRPIPGQPIVPPFRAPAGLLPEHSLTLGPAGRTPAPSATPVAPSPPAAYVLPDLPETAVVSREGTPRQVYHGTSRDFAEFVGSEADPQALYGPGMYFTENPTVASGYSGVNAEPQVVPRPRPGGRRQMPQPGDTMAGGVVRRVDEVGEDLHIYFEPEGRSNVRPAYLDIKKPFDIEASLTPEDLQTLSAAAGRIGQDHASRYLRGVSRTVERVNTTYSGQTLFDELTRTGPGPGIGIDKATVGQILKTAGYDGITHIGGNITGGVPHRVWIAFDPAQVHGAFTPRQKAMADTVQTLVQATERPEASLDDVVRQIEQAVAPAPQGPPSARVSVVRTSAGREVETEYILVNADDLITSVDAAGNVNPQFPQELQPRDRSRIASQAQVESMAARIDPAQVAESRLASTGAPIVDAQGVVESGNGRTLALQRMYARGGDQAETYRQFLKDNATRYGMDPAVVDAMEKPVLVRRRTSELSPEARIRFTQEANARSEAAMSAREAAGADATRITDEMLTTLNPSQEGNLAGTSNREFTRQFMAAIPEAERGALMTAEGRLSQQGVARMRNALFAKVYGDTPALARLAEDTESSIRNITTAMTLSLQRMARLQRLIREGAAHDLDIAPELAQAATKLSALRDAGDAVPTYLKQLGMFGDELSPTAKSLLVILDAEKRSSQRLGNILATYAEQAERAGDPRQVGMFAQSAQVPSKMQVLQETLGRVASETGRPIPKAVQDAMGTVPRAEVEGLWGSLKQLDPDGKRTLGALITTGAVTSALEQNDAQGLETQMVEAGIGSGLARLIGQGLMRLAKVFLPEAGEETAEGVVRGAGAGAREGIRAAEETGEEAASRMASAPQPPLTPRSSRLLSPDLAQLEDPTEAQARHLLERSEPISLGGVRKDIPFHKIDTDEDVQQVLAQVSDLLEPSLTEARRLGTPMRAEADLARAMGMTVQDLHAFARVSQLQPKVAAAANEMLVASGKRLTQLRDGVLAGDTSLEAEYLTQWQIHGKIQRSVAAIRAEAGRTLGMYRLNRSGQIDLIEPFSAQAQRQGRKTGVSARQLAQMHAELPGDQVAKMARDMTKPTASGALLELWMNNILSSPKTAIVNAAGSVMGMLLAPAERGLSTQFARATGGDFVAGEATAKIYGQVMSVWDALITFNRTFRAGAQDVTRMEFQRTPQFTAEAFQLDPSSVAGSLVNGLGHLIRTPGRFLEATDQAAKLILYRGELQAQAVRAASNARIPAAEFDDFVARFLADPPEEAIKAATRAREVYTFTQSLTDPNASFQAIRSLGIGLQQATQRSPLLKLVVPFIRTPVNLASFMGERTPVINLMSNTFRRQLLGSDPNLKAEALTKLSMSAGVMSLVATLSASGLITGSGPRNKHLRARLEERGIQFNSIKIGDKWVNFDRADPIGAPLGVAADLAAAIGLAEVAGIPQRDIDEIASKAVLSFANLFTNRTYMKGLAQVLDAVRGGAFREQKLDAATRIGVDMVVSAAVPNIVAELRRTIDPVKREMETALDRLYNRIPGLSDTLEPVTNAWGEPVLLGYGVGPGVMGDMWNFLAPFKVTQEREFPAALALEKAGIAYMGPGKTLDGVELTPKEHNQLKKIMGDHMRPTIERLAQLPAWSRLSDGEEGGKELAVLRLRERYRQVARAQLLRDPQNAALVARIREHRKNRLVQTPSQTGPSEAATSGLRVR